MTDPFQDEPAPEPIDSKGQFGIAALFWLTFIVGLGLAYLQQVEGRGILQGGLITIGMGLLAGGVIGWLTNKLGDAIFWSTLIAAFGYICVCNGVVRYPLEHRLAWSALGAVSGAISATLIRDNWWANLLLSALAGASVVGGFWCFSEGRTADWMLDLIAAPLVGAGVSIFVWIQLTLESKRPIPRYMTATWLLVVVIIGNLISDLMQG